MSSENGRKIGSGARLAVFFDPESGKKEDGNVETIKTVDL